MAQSAKVIDLYDSLLDAKDDRTRAKIIAGAFESLEDRYPISIAAKKAWARGPQP